MGRGPRPDDSQPTPAATGSVAMPRDGDPMNQKCLSLAPVQEEPSTRPLPFDGFPYLVSRIGRTTLRHIALLPADWPRARLVEAAHRQVAANRLDTCLCLGPEEAVYVAADGTESTGDDLPWGVPVVGALALPEPLPRAPELLARHAALQAFARRHPASGYLVGDGLEGGRPATAEDVKRLSGRDDDGVPRGLGRCAACGQFRGDFLALEGEGNGDMTPRVVSVHCRCENHNRCARCGEPLAGWRLSAYHFAETDRAVRYAAAYMAFAHRCSA